MDICLIGTREGTQLRPESIHGMLWLQTHFENATWEAIASKKLRRSKEDAELLSNDAESAGLEINRVSELSTPQIF